MSNSSTSSTRLARRGGALISALVLAASLRASGAAADACQTPGFVAPARYDIAGTPAGLASGDFNGDGLTDLVALGEGYGESHVVVLLGNADGTFQPGIVTPLNTYLYEGSMATGVFDTTGGHLDLVIGGLLLRGHGDGTFEPPVSVGVEAQSIAAVDVDGDGNLDIVGAGTYIDVVLGDGHGGFTGPFRTPAWSSDVAIGDVDGDGIPDAVGTRSLGGSLYDAIVYYPGRADGTFDPSVTLVTHSSPDSLHAVHLADLDGNGDLDVLALQGFTIVAALGHGNGTLDPPVVSSAPPAPIQFGIADFDGDGRPDVAVTEADALQGTTFGGALEVFLGSGDGAFTSAGVYSTGTGSYGMTVAGLGGSGRPGVAVGGYPDLSIWVLLGNGDGTLLAQPQYGFGSTVRALAVGDFNEDGRLDLANVWDYFGQSRIEYLFGGPRGQFSTGGYIYNAAPFASLQAADVNGDGHLDLATLDRSPALMWVFQGDGHGGFTPRSTTPVPSASYFSKLLLGDLTGDGVPDAISLDPDASLTANQIGVLLANGDGSFTPAAALSFPVPVSDASIADLNGDGFGDLAVLAGTPYLQGQLFILLGNGDGTFHAPIVYDTRVQPGAVVAARFDGNATLDLVVGQSADDGSGVAGLFFPGNGDGTFGASQPITLDFVTAMAAADVRGIGINDLIVANNTHVSLSYGNGDGTFGAPLVYPAGSWMSSLAVGDFDGNGTLDAAAGNAIYGAGGTTIFFNAKRAVSVADATGAPGQAARLYAGASGLGPVTYQWRKSGVPLADGGNISGSQAGTLTISPVSFGDAGSYDVIVTDTCGSTTSNAATFSVEFADVPVSSPFHGDILTIAEAGITSGCGGGNYCPTAPVRRDQMAVFLLKSEHGSSYVPPACAGLFADVACPSAFADWVEQLSAEGITSGCGGGNYCPSTSVTRAQMAVFLLKTKNGSSYTPPTATGVFGDVPVGSFAADFIEALYNLGISGGCQASPLLYCPNNPVLRQQMATFLVRTFAP